MKLGLDVKKLKELFKWRNLRQYFFDFLSGNRFKFFIFAIALLSTSCSIYIWYNFIYKPGWSESRKQEYIRNKDKGIIFNRLRFEDIVAKIESRKIRFRENVENLEDIFKIKN